MNSPTFIETMVCERPTVRPSLFSCEGYTLSQLNTIEPKSGSKQESKPESKIDPKILKPELYEAKVKEFARYFVVKLTNLVEYDDLYQTGYMGLLDGIERLKKGGHTQNIAAYLNFRIRGAILSQLRADDEVFRSSRAAAKTLAKLETELQAEGKSLYDTGNEQLDGEVRRLNELAAETRLVRVYSDTAQPNEDGSLEHLISQQAASFTCPATPSPEQWMEEKSRFSAVAKAMNDIPTRESFLVDMMYEQDLPISKISVLLNVSDSMITRIHQKAIENLKSKIAH
jgi:RNA polymerase sigma factor for flagellar operon FliA